VHGLPRDEPHEGEGVHRRRVWALRARAHDAALRSVRVLMTVQPMPSVKIHEGKYIVIGTTHECIVERAVGGRWCLDVNGEFREAFDTKREALVYCQENTDL
jgi:hypothetical protein